MDTFRYIEGAVTLQLDQEACIGCGSCVVVCPHRILYLEQRKAYITNVDLCMECGACQANCPTEAITVDPGVGCAAYIIAKWVNRLLGREIVKGCC
ncbi:mercury methylation ferredoxin HgcB [Desulfogranum marinum]|uniref:mercury methylation ferredoxin HgcB n=1 Tax=Desulfogranum marinum TaxID=453220 RepID=UPI0019661152|nr:4Fe-4S binding protein [Desulfogranum marinum]